MAPVLVVALLSGAVPLTGIAVVPVAGIVVGGAMTATSQGGRRALDDLEAHRDQYEAGLALGGRRRDAAMIVCRPAATQALVPPMDLVLELVARGVIVRPAGHRPQPRRVIGRRLRS